MHRQLTRWGLACLVAVSLCGWVFAQEHENGNFRDAIEYGYHNGYVDGFQHGREDQQAQVGYSFESRDYENGLRGYESYMGPEDQYENGYREGYLAGYDDGFQGRAERFMGPSHEPRYDRDSGPPNVAFRVGYNDGLVAGGKDRRKDKQFRPEKHDQYKDGDHGYSHDYGRKQDYKRSYREGYVAGYERGYGGFHGDGY